MTDGQGEAAWGMSGQVTPVEFSEPTPVKWFPDFSGQGGQAQIARIL
jgi:hypothetical protein